MKGYLYSSLYWWNDFKSIHVIKLIHKQRVCNLVRKVLKFYIPSIVYQEDDLSMLAPLKIVMFLI